MGFFSRVLPAKGPFTLFTGVTGPDGKLAEQRHWNGLQSHEALEKKIQELSTQPLNVFFAAGSYAGPNRRDPIAKRALWLDLDFKDLGSLKDALLGLSAFVRAVGLPPPSIYVSSGRGVHVYWCLNRDVPVAEWEPVADALKEKCKELGFAADLGSTADPARVLRAPSTLNRKGKDPIPCVVLSDNGTTHSIESIAAQLGAALAPSSVSKLLALAPPDALITKPNYRSITADEVAAMLACVELPPLGSRDEWVQILCAVQDWGQKSEEAWDLFDAWSVTQPAYDQAENRRIWDSFEPDGGITIGTLVKIATDAGYVPAGVSLPVTPAMPASLAEQVATATVEDEEETPVITNAVVSDPLMIAAQHTVNSTGRSRFNMQEAVNYLAGEFVIITEQEGIFYSMTKRAMLTSRVIDDLLTRYMPLNANHVPTNATLIMRRYGVKYTVQSPGFHPTAPSIYSEGGTSYVNRYTAPPQMIPALPAEITMLDMFWAYMFPRPEDQQFSQYLRQSYGHLVQRPEIKIESAPLIIGPPGTGKTTLAHEVPRRLVGYANSQLVSNKTLRGAYNSYAGNKHLLYFDEIHVNGKWDSDDIANSLKNLVVGSVLEVHPKFMSPFEIPNRVFVTATSNYKDAMSLASDKERRWGVYEHVPPSDPIAKKPFFTLLYRWMNSPRGPGVLRWYFSQVDLTGYSPHDSPPMTGAKLVMVDKSQIKEVQILTAAARDGDAPFDRAVVSNEKIRQFLHSETGKTYSGYDVREFVRKALPDVVVMKKIRTGTTVLRSICWKDQTYWMDPNRTVAEIKKEMS